MIIPLLQTFYLGSNSVVRKLSLQHYVGPSISTGALSTCVRKRGNTKTVPCNAAYLWESVSACVRKRNKSKTTNQIHNFNEYSTASDSAIWEGD